MNDLDALEAALDICPPDWVGRLAYADLLEAAGREGEATFQRWAAANRVSPHCAGWGWTWSQYEGYWTDPAILPRELCGHLSPPRLFSRYGTWHYKTRLAAEDDLRRAVEKIGYDAADEMMRQHRLNPRK